VRGLSLSQSRLGRLVGGEVRTGLIIGLLLGAITTAPAVWIGFGDGRLAIAVALAPFFAGGFATSIGLLLPWVLGRLGSDPVYGSGPLPTILQDVLSLLIYFTVVQLIVL
jgi:magnesium transporter